VPRNLFLRASFSNIDKNVCGGFREKNSIKIKLKIGLMGAESEGANWVKWSCLYLQAAAALLAIAMALRFVLENIAPLHWLILRKPLAEGSVVFRYFYLLQTGL
jgi:hypothetical protein